MSALLAVTAQSVPSSSRGAGGQAGVGANPSMGRLPSEAGPRHATATPPETPSG
jgi:hypothetical protein